MEAGPQAGCVAAHAIGAWTHRAGGSEKAFTIGLSMATCVSKHRPMAVRRCSCIYVPPFGLVTARKAGAFPFGLVAYVAGI